jgi:hypothetical protein
MPSSGRLMNIMAKQATNRISTIKLPDGQDTQTRVHFADLKADDSNDGQGQQNLDI